MASLLFIVGGVVVNALAFSGTNFVFNRLTDHGAGERKRHDLAEEELQETRDKWNEYLMERLDFIKKRLREQNKARACINDTDQAMLEYYRIFAKKLKSLLPEPELSDFYHPSETQKKMVSYYLLQSVQALQHMLYTNTLNK